MQNKIKDISIIMSIYDGDKIEFVKETLISIDNQIFKNFDCIIVFDGMKNIELKSSILDYIASLNFNYQVIDLAINKGLAYCMNLAINKSDSKYLARMDSDDLMMPNRLLLQYDFLEKNPLIDVLGSCITEFDEQGNSQKISFPIEHNEMKLFFGKRNPLAHPSVLFRISFFEKAKLYPLNTNKDEDTMLWLSGFLSDCNFANLKECLVKMRISNDFYNRRGGVQKAKDDFYNRIKVINRLSLSKINYFFAFARFIIQIVPSASLKRILYKKLR